MLDKYDIILVLRNGVFFLMTKGVSNKRYTGEFKQMAVETMIWEKLSDKEASR